MTKYIACSFGVHVVAILLVLFAVPSSGPRHSAEPGVAVSIELNKPATEERSEVNIAVEYRGAPRMAAAAERAGSTTRADSSAVPEDTRQVDSVESVKRPAQELELPAADVTADRGLVVPTISVDPFDDYVVTSLISSGAGLVGFWVDSRVVVFDGSDVHLLDQDSAQNYSRRALSLPLASSLRTRAIRAATASSRKLGFPAERLHAAPARVLINRNVDAMILERQKQAASRYQLPLDELVRTSGRFILRDRRVVDFVLTALESKTGQQIALENGG